MADLHDTLVDPKIRREVERPRTDARRPMLLIAIVTTSALAGAALMGLMLMRQRGPEPVVPSIAPVAVPIAPAPVVEPRVAPVAAPAAPEVVIEPAVEPMAAPTRRPCPSYGQKGEGAELTPPRNDCLSL